MRLPVSPGKDPNIRLEESKLYSLEGAKFVIDQISSRKTVTNLILANNHLGDNGCVKLFDYLCSEKGGAHRIQEISLIANDIGDEGLRSIARYLEGNNSLKELSLQGNAFKGDPDSFALFARSINLSRLRFLALSSNFNLNEGFIPSFLTALDAPYLQDLHLSMIGLTSISTPYIEAYLRSPRCRPLRWLKLNGNSLGSSSLRRLVDTLEQYNFNLSTLEVYSNTIEEEFNWGAFVAIKRQLNNISARNKHLQTETENEAFVLLRCARAVLLRSSRSPCDSSETNIPQVTPVASSSLVNQSKSSFKFANLPTELQLHTLSFATPYISVSQRLRIFRYASDRSTLPPLLPSLKTWMKNGVDDTSENRIQRERERWLNLVGCNYYEPD